MIVIANAVASLKYVKNKNREVYTTGLSVAVTVAEVYKKHTRSKTTRKYFFPDKAS